MLRQRWHKWLDRLGLRLAGIDALPQLAMLAIPVGLLSGLVIILLRLLVESGLSLYLPEGEGNFEALSQLGRFILPVAGGLLIGIIWQFLRAEDRQVGILHVMERLAYHQASMPLRNALAQFAGIVMCIMSGQSIGREGPGAHLGAASGGQLSNLLHLPYNSRRTLVACGIAAAIAASFNTPLAGVIFSMEVVMMEYTLVSFAPVILAAVIATTMTQVVFGNAPVFTIPPIQLGSLLELPIILMTGVLLGCIAALFIHLMQRTTHLSSNWPIWLRCTLAGVITGSVAVFLPEVMGIGYDTVNQTLLGNLALGLLVMLLVGKVFVTALGLGLGLPGGLISPTLVIGAIAGGAIGIAADTWLPGDINTPAFYALIGMGTVMGATLQAPLAALTAMLELTANPHIILPGMLALIAAVLVSREVFGKQSVFLILMKTRGLEYNDSPMTQTLRRVGVASVMERDVELLPPVADRERIIEVLGKEPEWILAANEDENYTLMPAADIARYLQSEPDEQEINVAGIPAERQDVYPVNFQATLQDALDILRERNVTALYVTRHSVPGISRIHGVVTRSQIDRYYSV